MTPAAMALVRDADAGLRAVVRGATVLQLRDPEATAQRLEGEARRLIATAPVPVLVNSHLDIAVAVGAYGVHLPEADVAVAEARRLLPKGVVGRSVHSLESARRAAEEGADYLVFGPVFETGSHSGRPPVGLEALREVAGSVSVPVLAIGGVDGDRVEACQQAGAAGFAAIAHFG